MKVHRRRLVGPAAAGLGAALAATAPTGRGASSPLSKDVALHIVAADYGDPKTHNSSTAYWNNLVQAFEKDDHRAADGAFLNCVCSPANALKFADRYGLLPVASTASRAAHGDPEQVPGELERFAVTQGGN